MRTHSHLVSISILAGSLLAPVARGGYISQSSIVDGGAMVNACAGSQAFSGLPTPGATSLGGATDQFVTCNNQAVASGTVSQSASNSGSYQGTPFSNSASATAALGQIHISATNSGAAITTFAGAIADAGFNDSITVNSPNVTLSNGLLHLEFQFDGTMSASGAGARGMFEVAAYMNHFVMNPYGGNAAAYTEFLSLNNTHNPGIGFSFDSMMIARGVYDDGTNTDFPNYNATEIVTFVFPLVSASPIEIGIWANLIAGENASGGGNTLNSTSVDFSHTISYLGAYVTQNGQVVNGVTYSSAGGFDYSNPVVPEPATWTLGIAAAGLAGVAKLRRRA